MEFWGDLLGIRSCHLQIRIVCPLLNLFEFILFLLKYGNSWKSDLFRDCFRRKEGKEANTKEEKLIKNIF
jgi:hypothetical protein